MASKNKLVRDLEKYERMVMDEVKDIIRETALLLQKTARAKAAEDTGWLKDSIEVDILSDGLTAIVYVGAEYQFYIEFGTGIYAKNGAGRKTPWVYYNERYGQFVTTQGMKAQPFWNPSIEIASKYFVKEMKKIGI